MCIRDRGSRVSTCGRFAASLSAGMTTLMVVRAAPTLISIPQSVPAAARRPYTRPTVSGRQPSLAARFSAGRNPGVDVSGEHDSACIRCGVVSKIGQPARGHVPRPQQNLGRPPSAVGPRTARQTVEATKQLTRRRARQLEALIEYAVRRAPLVERVSGPPADGGRTH